MNRPPRNPQGPLFGKRTVALSLLQGLIVLGILLAVFSIALYRGQGEAEARALTFTTLIVANLALIFTNRAWSPTNRSTLRSDNLALKWVLGGTLVLLALVLYVPFLRSLFHLCFLHPTDLLLCLSAGVFSVLWFEWLKALQRRKKC